MSEAVKRLDVLRAAEEAIGELKANPVICGALGEHILSHFLDAKQAEWDEYRTHVSNWEVERYLELY
jgi:glutamine synthetase